MNSNAHVSGVHRKRMLVWLMVFFILVSLIGSCTYYVNRRTNPFPELSQIEDITVTMIDSGVVSKRGHYDLKLKVPKDEYPTLKELFKNSQIDRTPAKWEVLYGFEITERSGDTIRVMVFTLHYDDQPHEGAFKFNNKVSAHHNHRLLG